MASPPLAINQDVLVYYISLKKGETFGYELSKKRACYLHVPMNGSRVTIDTKKETNTLNSGDGLFVEKRKKLQILGLAEDSNVLLFDLRRERP